MGPCTLCGFCERYGCFQYSKSSPQTMILDALRRRLPEQDFVYLGDNAHAPYGTRSPAEVYDLTLRGVTKPVVLDAVYLGQIAEERRSPIAGEIYRSVDRNAHYVAPTAAES